MAFSKLEAADKVPVACSMRRIRLGDRANGVPGGEELNEYRKGMSLGGARGTSGTIGVT